jgi:predicted transcriptional regulator
MTIRVSTKTHAALTKLARERGQTLGQVLDQAVEAERRRRIVAQANEGYAALRADPAAWAEVQTERAALGM